MGPVTYTHDKTTAEYWRIAEHYGILELPYGPMIVNMHDPSMPIMLRENIQEIRDLQQFATSVVLDIGANVGSHSVNFAKTAGQVYAFEPHPRTYNNLCANLLLHLCPNVTPLNMALGAYNGEAQLGDFDITEEHFSMGAYVGNGTLKIQIRTIDSFCFSPVNFIKIDTEGYEFEILRGANNTLQRESPIVFVEIHLNELIGPIIAYMEERGYETREFVSYFIMDKDTGERRPLTRGQLFWKPGRIEWAEKR